MPGYAKCGQAAFVRQTGQALEGRGPMRRMGMPTTPATAANNSSNGAPEAILLELVDEHGNTIGTAEKLSAHQAPGQLHRAFSVFLFDEQGRLLLQRRALGKYHSPGVWSNTCCGHPYPGRGAVRGRRPAHPRGAGGLARRCSPRRARSATTTRTRPRGWWSRSTTTSSWGWCRPAAAGPGGGRRDGLRDRRRSWRSGMTRRRSRRGS